MRRKGDWAWVIVVEVNLIQCCGSQAKITSEIVLEITVTPSGSNKVLQSFMNTENQLKSKEWSSYRRKKKWQHSVTWQNPTNPWSTESTLRMKGSSSEETALFTGGPELEARTISLELWLWMWGVPKDRLWNSSKRIRECLTRLQVCTAGLHALTPNSCLALIQWGYTWETGNERTWKILEIVWLCYLNS